MKKITMRQVVADELNNAKDKIERWLRSKYPQHNFKVRKSPRFGGMVAIRLETPSGAKDRDGRPCRQFEAEWFDRSKDHSYYESVDDFLRSTLPEKIKFYFEKVCKL